MLTNNDNNNNNNNNNNYNNNNKGKSKGKGKGVPATAFSQLRPCRNFDMFRMPDGSVAPILDGNIAHTDHTGVAMMSAGAGIKLLEEIVAQGGDLTIQPLAILIPCTDKDALDRNDALGIVHKFRPQHIK